MNEHTFALAFWFSLALLWWVFAFPYRKYRVDLLRQRLFIIRDELFHAAREGHLGFDAEAYRITRTTLNGMIRYAHELSLLRVLVTLASTLLPGGTMLARQYHRALRHALRDLTEDQRKRVINAHADMHIAVLSHLARTSVVLAPVAVPLWWAVKGLARVRREKARKASETTARHHVWTRLDAEANDLGRVAEGAWRAAA